MSYYGGNTTTKEQASDVVHHKVLFHHKAWQRMTAYVDNCEDEICGLGEIELLPPDENRSHYLFVVHDVFLVGQEVTGASASITTDGLAEFYKERLEQSPDTPLSMYKMFWHSHVNMDVFWSARDNETINDMDSEDDDNNWLLSVVINKRYNIKARVDQYRPLRLTQLNVPVQYQAMPAGLLDSIIEEIGEKVSKYKAPIVTTKKGGKSKKKGKKGWHQGYGFNHYA